MKSIISRVGVAICAVFLIQSAAAQTTTKTSILKQAAVQQAEKERLLHERLVTLAAQKGWEMVRKTKNGGIMMLTGIDDAGYPLYTTTYNNITAAATIGTNKLWPGGITGLNLNGSAAILKDKLAIWDGGSVRSTHVELVGRVIQKDAVTPAISDHSTHVAGTMIASGVNPLAKGMSFGMQRLVAYDFNNHLSEMLNESPNLLISNHSYGSNSGWVFNEGANRWEFWGLFGTNEDYKFGYYSSETQVFDSIAYNAPYYLIVKSSGNNRDENGPAVGQPYFRFNASGVMASAGNRPAGISDNDGYDIIPTYGVSKNILTIGAVNPIAGGYTRPADVVQSSFTSWGPTDDGRIKPDVVADGVNLLSSIGTGDNDYAIFSGTSMSSPNASGSLLLLQEYYNKLHAANPAPTNFMRAATLKGLVIHTADEAGPAPGPDYQTGWGLIDMQKAAAVITADNTTHTHIIQENVLNNGGSLSLPVIASGNGTISATISWTDPKGSVEPVESALNNSSKKLVNDLDITITKGATTWRPWTLNPFSPSSAAVAGDNTLDNVEKVELPDVVPGDTYTIHVTHKGTLERGSQAYSLIASGVGGTAYCASNPTSNAGARIDSVSFGNIQKKNTAGCTTYSNFTTLTGNLEPGASIPFFARLSSCDASNADKILKVFMDGNNDGDFTDAGETLATSGVINGNGDFSGTIAVPASLVPGKYTLLRIVMQETNVAANVTPCGTYTRGETQDYRIFVSTPALDFGVSDLVSPIAGDCATGEQYVSVAIRNFGTADKKNIPLTAVIKQGATTVATLTATYADTVYAGTTEVYTFQTSFVQAANTAYTITASTSFPGDQNASNDQNVSTYTTGSMLPNPTGTAVVCGTNVLLKATPTGSDPEVFNWYNSATATTPIVTGTSVLTTNVLPAYFLSKNEISKKLGPVDKMVFTDGGYNIFVNNVVKFTATTPSRIETARLYIGNSGKITFLVRQIVSENADGSYTYFPISSRTIDVYATAPTPPTLGANNNNPADAGAIYYLGLDFPEAANYYVVIQCENGASIFRNNNIPVASYPYPYTVPGVLSLTGNSAIDPIQPPGVPDPQYFQKFYYFFYNATVKINSCASNRVSIVPTTVTVPTISLAGNVFTSSAATGNQWILDGTPIPGATSNTYTATQSGNYAVSVTTSGCTLNSAPTTFTVTAVPNVDPAQIGLVVSPVPARGQFDVKLEVRTKSDLDILLLSTSGQQVYHSQIPGFIGKLNKTIVPGKIAPGVYYLQIVHDKKMYIQKVIIIQ